MHQLIRLFILVLIVVSFIMVGGCTSEEPPEPKKTVVKKIKVKPPTPPKTSIAQVVSPSPTPSPKPSVSTQAKSSEEIKGQGPKSKPIPATEGRKNDGAPAPIDKPIASAGQPGVKTADPTKADTPTPGKKKIEPEKAPVADEPTDSSPTPTPGVPKASDSLDESVARNDLEPPENSIADKKTPGAEAKSQPKMTLAQQGVPSDSLDETRAPDILASQIEEQLEPEKTTSSYNPQGKIDPFAPFITPTPKPTPSDKPEEIIPQSPLQTVDLAQLDLVGIIRAPSGNLALVQMASGKGYIIQKGTAIGDKQGHVAEILADSVVVEEKGVDSHNEPITKERLMKIKKPAGEL